MTLSPTLGIFSVLITITLSGLEFDGLQHFKPLGFQGGLEKLEYTRKCDKIKDEYCKNKNIHLLRISYINIRKINDILKSIILI